MFRIRLGGSFHSLRRLGPVFRPLGLKNLNKNNSNSFWQDGINIYIAYRLNTL